MSEVEEVEDRERERGGIISNAYVIHQQLVCTLSVDFLFGRNCYIMQESMDLCSLPIESSI